MNLTSTSFANNSSFPTKFRADQLNINPELIIENVPENAASLALVMHDINAMDGHDFTHWLIWNIDPGTQKINSGIQPPHSISGRNDFGNFGYGGPLPHVNTGLHHYVFDLYALDAMSNLLQSASRQDLCTSMQDHVLAHAQLIGTIQT